MTFRFSLNFGGGCALFVVALLVIDAILVVMEKSGINRHLLLLFYNYSMLEEEDS